MFWQILFRLGCWWSCFDIRFTFLFWIERYRISFGPQFLLIAHGLSDVRRAPLLFVIWFCYRVLNPAKFTIFILELLIIFIFLNLQVFSCLFCIFIRTTPRLFRIKYLPRRREHLLLLALRHLSVLHFRRNRVIQLFLLRLLALQLFTWRINIYIQLFDFNVHIELLH